MTKRLSAEEKESRAASRARALDADNAESADASIREALAATSAANRAQMPESARAAVDAFTESQDAPAFVRPAPVLAAQPEPSGFDSPRARAAAETLRARQRAAEERAPAETRQDAPQSATEEPITLRGRVRAGSPLAAMLEPETRPIPFARERAQADALAAETMRQINAEEPEPIPLARAGSPFPFKTAIIAGAAAAVFIAALFSPAKPSAGSLACAEDTMRTFDNSACVHIDTIAEQVIRDGIADCAGRAIIGFDQYSARATCASVSTGSAR